MAITLPFARLSSSDSIHYSEDPTLGKCAIKLMDCIVSKNKEGFYCTNADIEIFFRLPKRHGYERFSYGTQARSTAKRQLEAAGYIACDRIQRNAKGWKVVREYRAASEIPNIAKSPYEGLPQDPQFKGFVYLFRRTRDNIYKIGVTTNLRSRAAAIACNCGSHVELLAALDVDQPYQIEQELHQCFDDKRLPGEWFELSHTDVTRIKGFFLDIQNGEF